MPPLPGSSLVGITMRIRSSIVAARSGDSALVGDSTPPRTYDNRTNSLPLSEAALMLLISPLVDLTLTQVFGGTVKDVSGFLRQHFTDNTQALPRALLHAHTCAWDAVGVALAGDGLADDGRRL